jgi:hypothetical protein
MRSGPDGPVEAVLVLRTLGAPQRRLLRGRRGRSVEQAEPEPVPTTRASLVRTGPFGSREEANGWLATLRRDKDAAEEELAAASRRLNRALHAHRVAAADPYAGDASAGQALVTRIGFGSGEEVADGRYAEAWELPRRGSRTKRSMEAPEERFAAILGGREAALACEELVLRARADLDAGRSREAALEARVALEALLAELERAGDLAADREPIGDAANAALRGDLPAALEEAVEAAVARMEAELRRRRLRG